MIKGALGTVAIVIALMGFIRLFQKYYKRNQPNINIINSIALVNEDNEVIKEWNASKRTGILIGKSTTQKTVDIDLSQSIYSDFTEEKHAVLNFAAGNWYVEDICVDIGVSIKKIEDGKQYRLVSGSPCRVIKGDILFIGKIKLLLR